MTRKVAICLLALFVVYFANVNFFYHSHIINGHLIQHSHIFFGHHGENPEAPAHSSSELALIKQINNYIATTPVLLAVSDAPFIELHTPLYEGTVCEVVFDCKRLLSLRAPPAVL